jgi:hypothetical protein
VATMGARVVQWPCLRCPVGACSVTALLSVGSVYDVMIMLLQQSLENEAAWRVHSGKLSRVASGLASTDAWLLALTQVHVCCVCEVVSGVAPTKVWLAALTQVHHVLQVSPLRRTSSWVLCTTRS